MIAVSEAWLRMLSKFAFDRNIPGALIGEEDDHRQEADDRAVT